MNDITHTHPLLEIDKIKHIGLNTLSEYTITNKKLSKQSSYIINNIHI